MVVMYSCYVHSVSNFRVLVGLIFKYILLLEDTELPKCMKCWFRQNVWQL